MKYVVNIIDRNSALAVANQIQSAQKRQGIMKIAATWKTNILMKEIVAETNQLFNHVKKADPKTLTH